MIINSGLRFAEHVKNNIKSVRDNFDELTRFPLINITHEYFEPTTNATRKEELLMEFSERLQNLVHPTFIQKIRHPINLLVESIGLTFQIAGTWLPKLIYNKTDTLVAPSIADQLRKCVQVNPNPTLPLDVIYQTHRKRMIVEWQNYQESLQNRRLRRRLVSNFEGPNMIQSLFQGDVQVLSSSMSYSPKDTSSHFTDQRDLLPMNLGSATPFP